MSTVSRTVGRVSASNFTKFVTNPTTVAVGSAVFLAPLIGSAVRRGLTRIPFLANNQIAFQVALVVVAFLVFLFASRMSGIPQAVLQGVAAAILISAISPFTDQLAGLTQRVTGA